MKVFDFNIKKGIYSFEIDHLNSDNHIHPVIEIISASIGSFSIETNNQKEDNLVFVIIDSNKKHKITAENCTVELLMIESHNQLLNFFLTNLEFD
ncbi:hypothetical protein [uncultured Aquimarina sp.]|uniref:hypothetical protein n=1 Tax=uncultured Aquimarina sp. TaxID=575652 RepID=UPI00260F88B9|nr:hypothetical protein [uncultured Aquimarina sp.]